ncbi:SIR2 family protein [Mesorhizobium sp. B2-1-8]|uniref:SIR2 family protein n=1 Tax=Mesorhizobium sp. B2-1-8 TaxID=2589967 RepID=UPI00112B14D0|nr:SIR2 family protein [Mesorhizobium sp. B2-1-8]UCI20184.1 SIR2 family protein [Mesorhizobium sp. B2-1-8]
MARIWPEALVREFAERRAVLFLGAGFSIATAHADGKTFPSWTDLLFSLSEKLPKKVEQDAVRKLLKFQNYLDAAQIIWDEVPVADLRQKLVDTFSLKLSSPQDLYRHIIEIDPQVILTTNYDKLIETALAGLSKNADAYNVCLYNQGHALDDIRSPQRSILKVHGCVTQPDDIILTRLQYFEARRKYPAYFQTVSAVLTINTTLFLGYSLSDPDIQLILEFNNLSTPSRNPHYALVQKLPHSSVRSALAKTYNIHFIEYPVGDHSKMALFFSELSANVVEFRRTRGIP